MTQDDREMLVRIDENTKALKHVVFGNGRPGLAARVDKLETSHAECIKRQDSPRQWPAIVASICAVVAVVWGFIGG